MRSNRISLSLFTLALLCSQAILAFGEEPAADSPVLRGMEPLMVCCTKRTPPTQSEWSALSQDAQRSGLLGGVSDFKSRTIAFNSSRYYTLNATEGTLASYGKMGSDRRYDRFGQIEGVEFSIDQNSWKERYVMNAAALLKLTGSRFLEYAGITLDTAVDKNRQIDITFLGTNIPKDKVIRQLNNNADALEYLDTLQQKYASYDHDNFKLVKSAPPAAKGRPSQRGHAHRRFFYAPSMPMSTPALTAACSKTASS